MRLARERPDLLNSTRSLPPRFVRVGRRVFTQRASTDRFPSNSRQNRVAHTYRNTMFLHQTVPSRCIDVPTACGAPGGPFSNFCRARCAPPPCVSANPFGRVCSFASFVFGDFRFLLRFVLDCSGETRRNSKSAIPLIVFKDRLRDSSQNGIFRLATERLPRVL